MGRPSELTEETRKLFLTKLADYPFPESVAIACGVGKSTYYHWAQLGRKGVEPYREFLEEVRRVRVDAKIQLAQLVKSAAVADPKNWKAAMTLLEKLDATRFGPNQASDHPKAPPDMNDPEFWTRFEVETRERLAILEERRRLRGELAAKLPEVVETTGEEQH